MRNTIKHTIMALVLLVTGCTYPFDIEFKESDGRMVVEGNIIIGGRTTIYVSSLNDLSSDVRKPAPDVSVMIENESGTAFYPTVIGHDTKDARTLYAFDMEKAPSDTRYRLRIFNKDNQHNYETPWCEVQKGAVIDRLSYIPEPEKARMAIAISLHSETESYFQWSYEEHWEFHAPYRANCYYIPNPDDGIGSVALFQNGENTYYCWSKNNSSELLIFSTEGQKEDRFEDLEFHLIPQTSDKLSILYYIEVTLQTLSKDCYTYLNNMKSNSDYNGSLFAPTPSEMAGNIHCTEDPSEQVIGFVNCSQVSKAHLFIDNNVTDFYFNPRTALPLPQELSKDVWQFSYYSLNMIPFSMMEDGSSVQWVDRSCADCRVNGGTKNKPAFWPNSDK